MENIKAFVLSVVILIATLLASYLLFSGFLWAAFWGLQLDFTMRLSFGIWLILIMFYAHAKVMISNE